MSKLFAHHRLECEVLVAGGGPAGVPAAIAAARAGASVILCQDRSVLGGNASSEVRMHVVGANFHRPEEGWFTESRETGIIEEIRLENAVRNPQRSPSMFDQILYEKVKAEPNIRLMLNTRVHDATVREGRIESVQAVRASTEDEFEIRARVFMDCTGDGGLGAAAGAPYFKGRESRDQYGESLALEVADEKTLGSTLLFMARKHDRPMPFVAPKGARRFEDEELKLRFSKAGGGPSSYEYGYWWLEWGGQLDTIKDNEAICEELNAIVMGIWDYIKNRGDFGAENWALDWFGSLPGKRESRRFEGQYVLTERDIMEAPAHADAIAYGGWPIDTHPPEGVDAPLEPPCVQHPVPHLFEIPLRACISRTIPNLLFAGRNISATHVAFASTRVMATCALVGEGGGVAAAHAVKLGVDPAALPADAVAEIQQRLLREDVFLIGQTERAGGNLAHTAHITASSELPEGPACNVISGQNRSVQGEQGARPERVTPGSHRWMSDPASGLPAWLELRWPAPVRIRRVELTFDTGLARYLTLSQEDSYVSRMLWGRPQPETVRAFRLRVEAGGQWRELAREEEHWARRYALSPEAPVEAGALRIEVDATWGLDHARIVRVAVWE